MESFVKSEFKKPHWTNFCYHNLDHTVTVVNYCFEIGHGMGISQKQNEILSISAWFHDIGYYVSYDQHEEESKIIAQNFLSSNGYPEKDIDKVLQLIDSTKNSVTNREGLLAQILHDADHQSIGHKNFAKLGESLRKEMNYHKTEKIKKKNWNNIQIEYLNNTHFLTSFAQQKYGAQKMKNINKLVKSNPPKVADKPPVKLGRGIETMYKVLFRNQINLSSIADNKANMLIGINAVMLSVLISMFGGGAAIGSDFTSDFKIVIPLGILLVTAGLAMVNAVLAARPNIPKIDSYRDDMSLFFFANFMKLNKNDFVDKMNDLKTNDDSIYSLLAEDIYDHGAVLNKKYYRLKIAYNIFMIGFTIAIISFAILQIFF